jgi:hypothetical protein
MMPTLELNAEDAAELRALLEHEFDELRMEAERTESGEFRARVQKRERLVRRLIEQLKT